MVRRIGHGGDGKCELVRHRDGSEIVRKTITAKSKRYENDIPTELYILGHILPGHDRIIRFFFRYHSPREVEVYYGQVSGGDLFNAIYDFAWIGRKIPEAFIWHLYLQLCEALAFLQLIIFVNE